MKLIVGLGNPGSKYKNNRHNIGFLLLDDFAKDNDLIFKKNKKFDLCRSEGFIMIKPLTFMNKSGIAITSALTKFRFDDLLVIVDDVNLPFGKIRLREKGGFGGHNGLLSIGEALGSEDFKRLRIGIGTPDDPDLSQYVLSNFTKREQRDLKVVFDFAKDLLNIYLKKDFTAMLELFSLKNRSYSEKLQKSQDR